MDAVFEILEYQPIAVDDIDRVVVKTHRFASDLDEKIPKTLSAKKSSIPYCVALAIVKKSVFLDAFDTDPTEDQQILNMARAIEVRLDPDLDDIHASNEAKRPSKVEIYLKNGKLLTAKKEVAKGWVENPLNDEEFEDKFKQLVKEDLSGEQTSDIISIVYRIEEVSNISQLTKRMVCFES